MPNVFFSASWLRKFSDPYAVLGVSVAADERRISRRYRDIAKKLHPDLFPPDQPGQKEFATHALSKVVNPTYQRLKQDKGRAESLAILRFSIRRLSREQQLVPKTPLAMKLLGVPQSEADVFYEQAVSQLAVHQYDSFESLESSTLALMELNLVFLKVKMGDTIIRAKRTGIMSRPQAQPVPASSAPTPEAKPATPADSTSHASNTEAEPEDYARRYYDRALTYAKAKNWALAITELKDAIRIAPKRSQYHALLGAAYYYQNLTGMAKVHIRQALKLNPTDSLALKYAPKLEIDLSEIVPPSSSDPPPKPKGGLLGGIFARRP